MDKQNEESPYCKMNELLVHVITWMNLENMLCERKKPDTKSYIV